MDIQKEEFEAWHFTEWKSRNAKNDSVDFAKNLYDRVHDHNDSQLIRERELKVWQASSITEGYVVVPKKATKEIAGAFWNAFTENPRAMTMAIAWDAMIKAVEKNDE